MERRRSVRRVPEYEEPLARVRLRTGSELTVVNVSDHGVLVEGSVRLLPGRHLDVHVVAHDGRILVGCRVTRSFVSYLHRDGVCYRSALAFDRHIDAGCTREAAAVPRPSSAAAPGSDYPALSVSDVSRPDTAVTA